MFYDQLLQLGPIPRFNGPDDSLMLQNRLLYSLGERPGIVPDDVGSSAKQIDYITEVLVAAGPEDGPPNSLEILVEITLDMGSTVIIIK